METEFQTFASTRKRLADQMLVFALDEQRYALRLYSVKRIVRIPEITVLPHAPEIVLGLVSVQGKVIPVINIRKRFGLSHRDLDVSNHLVIACTSHRNVGLVVDMAIGVIERTEEVAIAAARICPSLNYVEGVVKLDGELVLIHNLDMFLSLEEERVLEQAMARTVESR
jgi:purine-binding chemotaxis protein CheW